MQPIPIRTELNFRDLGGIETNNQKVIKFHQFYRGGALCDFDEDEINYFKTLNIKHIIDYRSEQECVQFSDPTFENIHYHNWNAMEDHKGRSIDLSTSGIIQLHDSLQEEGKENTFMLDLYSRLPFSMAYQNSFKLILQKETPIYFHCAAGKDRTGVMAMLLICLLGGSKEDALKDYEYSNVQRELLIKDFIEEYSEHVGHIITREDDAMTFVGVQRKYGELVFEVIDKQFGNIDNYFREFLNISDEERKSLQDTYTEDIVGK